MKLIFSFTFLFLVSCTQPKYVNINSTPSNQTNSENKADCSIQFNQSKICVTWNWEKKPTSSEFGSLIFKTFRLNAFDFTAIETNFSSLPQFVLWMPSMGHGSTPTETTQLDIGTYRVENVYFSMPGEWEMKFQIKDGDTVNDEAVAPITF